MLGRPQRLGMGACRVLGLALGGGTACCSVSRGIGGGRLA